MHKDDPLQIESYEGKTPGVRIFRFNGPITLVNLFTFQDEVRRNPPAAVSLLDLTAVPYMDSAGMGAVVNFYTHCTNKGSRMIVAGVSNRVLELFKMTRVDTVMPIAGTVEEAEARL